MRTVNNEVLKKCRYIDLFCGIGGFHLALNSYGAECVFASDIDIEVRKIYEKNFHICPKGDITKIAVEDIPEHDIICAGFPCQPFSISGNQQGFDDVLGRGKLFFNIVEIAKYHKPMIILLENVKNFKVHDNGKTFSRVKFELESIGYSVFDSILCASDFKVPQARNRLYIVAFRKDLHIDHFDFPQTEKEFKTLSEILIKDEENLISGNYYLDREYTITDNSVNLMRQLHRIGHIALGRQGERIYSIYGQSTTLSSQGGGIGGKTGMYLINNRVRKLYPRECARLMGFPDWFQLADSQEKCYKQFGNSVVVNVLQYIIDSVISLEEVRQWLNMK